MVNAGPAHSAATVQVRLLPLLGVTRSRLNEAIAQASEAGLGRDTEAIYHRGEGSQVQLSGPTASSSIHASASQGSGASSAGHSSAHAQPAEHGTTAADAHSTTSDTHSSSGQDPLPTSTTQSESTAPTTMSGTAVSIASPPDKSPTDGSTFREKDKDSSATATTTPVGKRRRDGQSVSEGAVTSSSLTELPSLPEDSKSPSKRAKKGLFSKFTFLCKSCINQQQTHPIDLDEGAAHIHDEKQALKGETANRGTQSSTSTSGIYTSIATSTRSNATRHGSSRSANPPAANDTNKHPRCRGHRTSNTNKAAAAAI